MKRKALILIPLLSMLALPGCDEANPSDVEGEIDEIEVTDESDESIDDALRAEIEGGQVEAAQFGRPDNSDRIAKIEELREQTCRHDGVQDGPPKDFAIERARGLDEPGFRIEEDQAAVARELAEDDDADVVIDEVRMPDEAYLAAQARYLAEKDDLDPEQRAARKEAILGE